MPICMMCGEQKRDVKNRGYKRSATPRLQCDDCASRTLAAVRARAADGAALELLTRLYAEHNGSLSQIARVVGSERAHVRQYLKRYSIGRYAKKGTK